MELLLEDCVPPPPPSPPLAPDPPPGGFIERAVIPAWGGSVSSVLIAFRGPCSAPMDPLQRRRRGATGWVLGTWRVAQAD